MPTIISHSFAAIAIAPYLGRQKLPLSVVMLGVLCTILPDVDVISFQFGIPYQSVLGHRGVTHSFVFATLVASCITWLYGQFYRTPGNLALIFGFLFFCTISHPILDAFTNGGHGVAFFSPFSNQRYFFSWRPIKVSPIGIASFLTSEKARAVLVSELQWVIMPCVAMAGAAWVYKKIMQYCRS